MSKSKQQVNAEVTRRGLVSILNDTKWRELQNAVLTELPFAPAYQIKYVLNPQPDTENFDSDVHYLGDWSNESFFPYFHIEWIRVRPRILRHRGKLITPEVQSVEAEFVAILHRYDIPYRRDEGSIWIYGYACSTGNLKKAEK